MPFILHSITSHGVYLCAFVLEPSNSKKKQGQTVASYAAHVYKQTASRQVLNNKVNMHVMKDVAYIYDSCTQLWFAEEQLYM